MSRFDAIDLSRLPPPAVVEALDYEAIRQAMLDDFRTRWPEYDAGVLESDPVVKLLEVAAYREMLLRARVNDAARAVMLASAKGSDLDHLGALYGVERKLLDAGDPEAVPPVAPTWEPDEEYRRRVQLAVEAFSTCGPEGAYLFHALSAHPDIVDAGVARMIESTADGMRRVIVQVTVLVRDGDSMPAAEVLDAVRTHLDRDDVRPLTDEVVVTPPKIVRYDIITRLRLARGPDPEVVRERASAQVTAYAAQRRRIGKDVHISGIIAAAQVEGVEAVEVLAPTADIDPGELGVAVVDNVDVEVAA